MSSPSPAVPGRVREAPSPAPGPFGGKPNTNRGVRLEGDHPHRYHLVRDLVSVKHILRHLGGASSQARGPTAADPKDPDEYLSQASSGSGTSPCLRLRQLCLRLLAAMSKITDSATPDRATVRARYPWRWQRANSFTPSTPHGYVGAKRTSPPMIPAAAATNVRPLTVLRTSHLLPGVRLRLHLVVAAEDLAHGRVLEHGA